MSERFGLDQLADASARFGATPVDRSRFELWHDERRFGRVSVSRMSGHSVGFTGAPSSVEESVDIAFIETGDVEHEHAESGKWGAVPGAVVVAPSWVPRRLRFPGEWSAVSVRVNRTAVEAFAPRLPDELGVFTERSTLDRAMHAFVAEVGRRERSLSSLERYAIEQLLTEMTGSVLLDRFGGGWSAGSPTAVLRDRAIAVIAQSRADPSLNAEMVAAAVQSSLRRVQAAFAEVDNSISAEIRRQRARLARSLLIDSRYDVLSIEQVAEQSGFGTTMSLRRALTEFYDIGPRELRITRGRGD